MTIRMIGILSGGDMETHFGRGSGQLSDKSVGCYGDGHQTALTTAERPRIVQLLRQEVAE